ncbi:MAG: hypothetical protein P1P74_04625 [Desulfuromonadales bacterium]|nr:hypothetical protein [Desulfuromonadales bacterium]
MHTGVVDASRYEVLFSLPEKNCQSENSAMTLLYFLDLLVAASGAWAGVRRGSTLLSVAPPLPEELTLLITALTVIVIRLLAIRNNWSLPHAHSQ